MIELWFFALVAIFFVAMLFFIQYLVNRHIIQALQLQAEINHSLSAAIQNQEEVNEKIIDLFTHLSGGNGVTPKKGGKKK